MDDVYALSDVQIQQRIGNKLKAARLKQNITQESLSHAAEISVSSVKKIEGGQIGTFESFLRYLRMIGALDLLLPLVDEERMSPSEYYEMRQSVGGKARKRAAGKITGKQKEDSEW